jgi:autotransporter-associated beta strand protein
MGLKEEKKMKTSIFNTKTVSSWVVALTLWTTVMTVSAATRTWSGLGGDSDWQTVGNWDTVPVASDVLIFSGNNQLSNINSFLDGTQFNGLIFSADAGSFILDGAAIKLAGPMTNVSANAQVINLAFTNTTAIPVYCETNVTFAGRVSGGTTLTKTGPGKLILNNSGIALNVLTLSGGTIELASDITLGPANHGGTTLNGTGGTITSSGGRILLGGGAGVNAADWFGGSASPIIIEAPIADGVTLYNNVDFYNNYDLILRGANTFTAAAGLHGTRVQIGVDCVGSVGGLVSGPFGVGAMTFGNGGYVSSDSSTPRTILNTINFAGNITLGHTILNGKLTFSDNANLGNAVRTVTANSEVQFDGALTNGGFVKAGGALVTLAGVNTYAGGTTISSNRLLITGSILDTGAFTLNNPTAIYTVDTPLKVGALTLTDGTIDGAGAVTGTSYTVSSGTISANLGGEATLTKTGAGTVSLSGANTYTATVVNAGILLHAKPSALYNGDNASWTKEKINVANGATLAFNVGGPGEFTLTDIATLRNNLTVDINTNGLRAGARIGLDTSNAAGANFDLAESIGNSTGLGAGTLGLTKLGTNTLTLAAANTYTGETTVNNGVLKANHAAALATGTTLTATGTGTLDLNGYNFTVANLGVGGTGGTITDNASGAETNTLTVTAFTTAGMSARIADGPTRVLALKVSNANSGPTFGNNANTFSGGLTLKHSSAGTRLTVGVAPVNTGTAGAIVSTPFGRGPITIGEAATDKAQIYMTAANATILNDMVFNTILGTDQTSAIRLDNTLTLPGTMTANLAPVNMASYTGPVGGHKAYLTGRITGPGTNGGLLLKNGASANGEVVTLNNQTGMPNDYAGYTSIETYNTLVLGAHEQVPHGAGKGDVYVYGKLNLNGFNETINGLYCYGLVDCSGGTLTVGDNNANVYFGGTVTNSMGPLTLVKTGTGQMTLAGKSLASLGTSSTIVVSNGTLSVGFAPPVTGVARWFDAALPGTITTNTAGRITQWSDLSGNNAHAVNAGPNRLPIYAPNTLNGKPTLAFGSLYSNDSGDYLTFTRDSSIRTVFSVFKGESFLLGDNSNYHFHRATDNDATTPLWNASASTFIRSGTTYVNRVKVDGTTFPMPTTANNGFNLITVQTTNSVIANTFNRDRTYHSGKQSHAEVLLYDRVLTETERQQVEDYLAWKWLGVGTPVQNPLSASSSVTVLPGATFDLNGQGQSLVRLSGGGSVSNGSLIITGAIDLTNGVEQATSINANLTLAPGAALCIDHTASASDVVAVSGTLKIEGANTVRLNTLGGAMPPFRVTLFSFGTLDGQENLSSWTVDLPPALQNYETRFHTENNQVYVNVFLAGTVIHLK